MNGGLLVTSSQLNDFWEYYSAKADCLCCTGIALYYDGPLLFKDLNLQGLRSFPEEQSLFQSQNPSSLIVLLAFDHRYLNYAHDLNKVPAHNSMSQNLIPSNLS